MPTPPMRTGRLLLLALFSLGGMVTLLGVAAYLVVSAMLQSSPPLPAGNGAPLSNFVLADGLLLCAALLVPAGYYSLQRIKGKPILPVTLRPIPLGQLLFILAVWIFIAIAAQSIENTRLAWLILPPLAVIGIALPVFALLRIGAGGLPLGSSQQAWGIFGVGMLAGPSLAVFAEFLVFLVFILLGGLVLVLHPEWMVTFERILAQLDKSASLDQIVTILSPYLQNPTAIILMLLALSVFTPLIEELVKPLGVWLLAPRLSPSEGFALGILSGAGFALLESLVAAASNDSGWGFSLVVRAGGGVMHILNTGLMGWAIASAWQDRHFLRLAGVYALAVTLHGLWNAMTVMILLGGLRVVASPQPTDLLGAGLTGLGMLILVTLALGGLITLYLVNRRLRSATHLAPVPGTVEKPFPPENVV